MAVSKTLQIGLLTVAMVLPMAGAANSQDTGQDWLAQSVTSDLYQPRTSVRMTLTVPLGATRRSDDAATKPRFDMGLRLNDMPGNRDWRGATRDIGLGLTFEGDRNLSLGSETLMFYQASPVFSAEGDEADETVDGEGAAKKKGSAAPWIIGGVVVVVGGGALLATQVQDDVDDFFTNISGTRS